MFLAVLAASTSALVATRFEIVGFGLNGRFMPWLAVSGVVYLNGDGAPGVAGLVQLS